MAAFSAQEALFIAVEMEKRAISFYERAQVVFLEAELAAAIGRLQQDERAHLARFEALRGDAGEVDEEKMLLSAEADGLLFSGGLMEAARKGAFQSREALITYAAKQEEGAIRSYQSFARISQGEARGAFLAIAAEEERHLRALRQMMPGEKDA